MASGVNTQRSWSNKFFSPPWSCPFLFHHHRVPLLLVVVVVVGLERRRRTKHAPNTQTHTRSGCTGWCGRSQKRSKSLSLGVCSIVFFLFCCCCIMEDGTSSSRLYIDNMKKKTTKKRCCLTLSGRCSLSFLFTYYFYTSRMDIYYYNPLQRFLLCFSFQLVVDVAITKDYFTWWNDPNFLLFFLFYEKENGLQLFG